MRPTACIVLSLLFLNHALARLEPAVCGSYRGRAQEELHLHRRAMARRNAPRAASLAAPPTASRDAGDIAIVEDAGDIIARRNDFNLDRKTIRFSPVAGATARYRFVTSDGGYDADAAAAGTPISPFGDDDAAGFDLPFAFPFFGASYRRVYVNSDGNLTFLNGDSAVTDRSLGRMTAGPPRIAGLFMDLDPSKVQNGVSTLAEAGRFVVSWTSVPEYQDFGTGLRQTFQMRLYPDGRVELSYSGVSTDGALVGITPGGLQGTTSIVSFAVDTSGDYSSTLAERFGGTVEIDIASAAQRFYQTHEDAYDYLVIYNNQGIAAGAGAVAFEVTTRNNRTGYGDTLVDIGAEFGSASRLQSVLNLGPLSQYPVDPNGRVLARGNTGDTPVTIIGHETGHLFLAYASVRDPNNAAARPMLGSQLAHWAFNFDSEASLLEGNRIRDDGAAVSPRFTTTGTVEGYAPLDQYLMGFRTADEVPAPFLVTGSGLNLPRLPQVGVSFNGQRRDVTAADIVAAEGRRTPDMTVSQRRFRFAFLLVVRQGTAPSQADLDQVDAYRRQFEAFYGTAASGRASADTALRSSLRVSTFPAAGVLSGASFTASLGIGKPAAAPLAIILKAQNGLVTVDPLVTIPAGATSVTFRLTGLRAGVDEISAQPADSRFDTAVSRIQVLGSADAAQLVVDSTDAAQVTFRIRDVNNLPYPGVRVQASAAGAAPVSAVSGSDGRVSFNWAPGQTLTARLDGATGASVAVNTATGAVPFSFTAPVNAASGAPGLSPGGIATMFGVNLAKGARASAPYPWPDNLAGVQVLLNGKAAPVLFVSDSQVNFLAPSDLGVGPAKVTLVAGGVSADLPAPATVSQVSPGIFFDGATGYGDILNAGTAVTTAELAAARGDYVEIYCTGLGPEGLVPRVTIGKVDAAVSYSGLASGYVGLYQVDARIPGDAPVGEQPISITIGGVQSNVVKIGVR